MAAAVKNKAIELPSEVVTYENINRAEMNKVIQVRVYRKWTAKIVPSLISTMYCCILLDKKVHQLNLSHSKLRLFENNICIIKFRKKNL